MCTRIITLFLLAGTLLSCQQKIQLKLSEDQNRRISGNVKSELYLAPVFSRYLKNLDMFSGVELSNDALPTTISNSLLPYQENQQNYSQTTNYDKKNKSYSVDFSFDFSDLSSLTESHIKGIISDVVSVEYQGNKTTLRIEFNQKNRALFERTLPLLLPMPKDKNEAEKKLYIKELAKIISESDRQTGWAEKEIFGSKIQVQVTTPRPILIISGGKITNAEKTQATIDIDLSKVVFLEKNQLFLITY